MASDRPTAISQCKTVLSSKEAENAEISEVISKYGALITRMSGFCPEIVDITRKCADLFEGLKARPADAKDIRDLAEILGQTMFTRASGNSTDFLTSQNTACVHRVLSSVLAMLNSAPSPPFSQSPKPLAGDCDKSAEALKLTRLMSFRQTAREKDQISLLIKVHDETASIQRKLAFVSIAKAASKQATAIALAHPDPKILSNYPPFKKLVESHKKLVDEMKILDAKSAPLLRACDKASQEMAQRAADLTYHCISHAPSIQKAAEDAQRMAAKVRAERSVTFLLSNIKETAQSITLDDRLSESATFSELKAYLENLRAKVSARDSLALQQFEALTRAGLASRSDTSSSLSQSASLESVVNVVASLKKFHEACAAAPCISKAGLLAVDGMTALSPSSKWLEETAGQIRREIEQKVTQRQRAADQIKAANCESESASAVAESLAGCPFLSDGGDAVREVCITKCGHTFKSSDLAPPLPLRQMRCPVCFLSFSAADVVSIVW